MSNNSSSLNYKRNNYNTSNKLSEADPSDNLEAQHVDKYYINLLTLAVIGIFLYYLGSFFLIFYKNVNGSVDTLPRYEVSWRLAFENIFELVGNFFRNFFGYFLEYLKLYGQENIPYYLFPVDFITKLLIITYFNFYWVPWDTKKVVKLGYFNQNYPYLHEDHEYSDDNEEVSEMPFDTSKKTKSSQPDTNATHQTNIYYRAQMLKMQNNQVQTKIKNLKPDSFLTDYDSQEDEEDYEDDNYLPFQGIHKPLEELYIKYEGPIYNFVRKRILPGSNLVIVLYFSTFFVVDFRNIWSTILTLTYLLGVMSMFWCMQTFLLVLDHNQYPPDENN